MVPKHPSGLNSKIVANVMARRGRMHAFERLEPRRTALVVVDLNKASVSADENCREIVPRINQMATVLRAVEGHVAWVLSDFGGGEVSEAVFGPNTANRFRQETSGEDGELWCELKREPHDIMLRKTGMSAFFPGKCDLVEHLRGRGIDAVLIAGTVTNVCCESSARDACELGYRVTVVSDACAGHAYGLHEASLATFYRSFGDVRPVSDVLALIAQGASA